MNLHEWITAKVDEVEYLLRMNEWPTDEAVPVRLRCEADRRILARHRLPEPGNWMYPGCGGCGTECDGDWPTTENVNDCPELLDLAHAHGITEQQLAGIDRPQAPPRHPVPCMKVTLPITTDQIPAALRGSRWTNRH